MIKTAFVYGPYAMLAATFVAFVLRCRFRVRVQAIWAMVLLVCFSKFLAYRELGGDAFTPDLPEHVIWVWNAAYSGAFILGILGVLTAFFRVPARAYVLPLAALALSVWGVSNGIRPPIVREMTLSYPDLPASLDGYRIVHITDLHVSSAARRWRTQGIVDRANACRGDLIVLTGDLVDGLPDERLHDVAPLRGLYARDGVFAVTGNHERYFDFEAWKPHYESWGIRFLSNACARPHAGLALGGVRDASYQPNPARAFEAETTNGEFRVLLCHRPVNAREFAAQQGVRLQLSGHTHGGVFPGMSWLVARANRGFVRGMYTLMGGDTSRPGRVSYVYVSPGVGQWAGFPIRFFNPTEITVFTLRRG